MRNRHIKHKEKINLIFKSRVKMIIQSFILLTALTVCVSAYSSFWAPLFDRSILNYRVDVDFDPEAGRKSRDEYEKNYGVRGERLVAGLGSGRRPSAENDRIYSDVNFYYTYGMDKYEKYNKLMRDV